jgi:hypothetical protein
MAVNTNTARQGDATDNTCSSVPTTASDEEHVDNVPMHTHCSNIASQVQTIPASVFYIFHLILQKEEVLSKVDPTHVEP